MWDRKDMIFEIFFLVFNLIKKIVIIIEIGRFKKVVICFVYYLYFIWFLLNLVSLKIDNIIYVVYGNKYGIFFFC